MIDTEVQDALTEYVTAAADWPTAAETLATLRAQEAALVAQLESVRAQIAEREAKPDIDVAERVKQIQAIHERVVASLEQAAVVAVTGGSEIVQEVTP